MKKTINFPDYIIILFLKKFDSHYILVDGRWKPSSFSLLISSAFIVDQQLIKNLPIDNPLAVLEQFAKEFGYEIKIGDQKSKFIHDARLEIPIENEMDDITKVLNDNISILNEGGEYLEDMLVRPQILEGKIYVDVALAYCISTEKYRQYLKSNNFI